jgi:hypothetical protein
VTGRKTQSPALLDRVDAGIRRAVQVLRENGIETTESCEGTRGHCYPEPTVCFDGSYEAGFRALAIAYAHGLKVTELRRCWKIIDGEPVGPEWQLTFFHPNGGGLHSVEQKNGKMKFEWGPVPQRN